MANLTKTQNNELLVLLSGKVIGTLRQLSNGSLQFSYNKGYSGTPLSVSMPIDNGSFDDKIIRPFLLGLLPDSPDQRLNVGRLYGVTSDNPFKLLQNIGFDCPGALQFCSYDNLGELQTRENAYIPISESSIAHELARISGTGEPTWQTSGEHWSLGGAQSKRAYAHFDGLWYECKGSAATTHIVKPGIQGLKSQALDEVVSLTLAHLCGVPSAETTYQYFEGIGALVVKRFDRVIDESRPIAVSLDTKNEIVPSVRRIHQEDFCQALSCMPEKKYTYQGGPSTRDIIGVLNKLPDAFENKLIFTTQLFYNFVIGASDAHAKNYSIIHDVQGSKLAPLYDCASTLLYEPQGGRRGSVGSPGTLAYPKAAMDIGGENRFFHLHKHHIEKYAGMAQLDPDLCVNLMISLTERVQEYADEACSSIQEKAGNGVDIENEFDEFKKKFIEPIMIHAATIRRQLD